MTSEKRAIAKWPPIMIELPLLHTVYIATYRVDRVLSVDQFTIFQFKNCVIDIRPILPFFFSYNFHYNFVLSIFFMAFNCCSLQCIFPHFSKMTMNLLKKRPTLAINTKLWCPSLIKSRNKSQMRHICRL